jgi:hypothetical protein
MVGQRSDTNALEILVVCDTGQNGKLWCRQIKDAGNSLLGRLESRQSKQHEIKHRSKLSIIAVAKQRGVRNRQWKGKHCLWERFDMRLFHEWSGVAVTIEANGGKISLALANFMTNSEVQISIRGDDSNSRLKALGALDRLMAALNNSPKKATNGSEVSGG